MDRLRNLIESGTIVDLMLIVVAVEIVVLIGYRLATKRGLPVSAILLNIGAGGSLMVALKLKYDGAPWTWLAAALLASLFFHVADLTWRWRRDGRTMEQDD